MYKKIKNLLDTNYLTNNSSETEIMYEKKDKKITSTRLSTTNYYQLVKIIDIDTSNNICAYTEFIVRIWTNYLAEVISYKDAHISDYQDVYKNIHGLERADKALQHEANQALIKLLDSIKKSQSQKQ